MKAGLVEKKEFRGYDGHPIAYFTAGEGLPVVLVNGLGGNWFAWKYFIEHFRSRFRIITWDYRGLYDTAPPENLESLRMENQTRDLEILLEVEKIEKAVIIGWSMGVQIVFELYRRHPEKFAALITVSGVPGQVFTSVFKNRLMRKALPFLIEFLIRFGDIQRPIIRTAFAAGVAFPFVKHSGFVAQTLPREIFEKIAGAYSGLDFKVYYQTMKYMGEHDACDVMDSVKVPSLIIYGGRDTFTPMERAKEMKARIRDSELFYLEDGSHYVMIEYPDLVHSRIEKFFQDNGLE